MAHGDKELLLKDLCARLPYGVKCKVVKYDIDGEMLFIRNGLELTIDNVKELVTNNMYEIKPYLFPLSSMTVRQGEEFAATLKYLHAEEIDIWTLDTYDWCNKNNFDYRGLIPMDLAIDATGLNIY